MNRSAYVYILASKKNGTLYIGVTSNLDKRLYEHTTKANVGSFTAKYDVNKLVWYVAGNNISAAIELEKKIKNRNRAWKIALIEKSNPEWKDLSQDLMDAATDAQHDAGVQDTSLPYKTLLSPCALVAGSNRTNGCCDFAQHDGRLIV